MILEPLFNTISMWTKMETDFLLNITPIVHPIVKGERPLRRVLMKPTSLTVKLPSRGLTKNIKAVLLSLSMQLVASLQIS